MTYYSRSGNRFFQVSSIPEYTALPAGTYALKFNPEIGFWFEEIENFELPKKVYGDLTRYRDRIASTFLSRDAATGVMLSGEKGSGKTLLGKALASHMREEHGIPTIVLNSPFCGDGFNTLIQEMKQPAIFMFDEFEKVYEDESHQQQILTLLDGVFPSKKLFVITTNDKWKVDRHMRNRPGRIFYLLEYKGLTREFVIEYAQDNLLDKSKVDSVVLVSTLFSEFNFDMLKALVEEMNRYGETAQQAMEMLNAKPEFEANRDYSVRLFLKGGNAEVKGDWLARKVWQGNPVNGSMQIEYYSADYSARPSHEISRGSPTTLLGNRGYDENDVSDDDPECDYDEAVPTDASFAELNRKGRLTYTTAVFVSSDLKKVGDEGFTFRNSKGECLILTKKVRAEADYWNSLI